jgi:3-methylfumaryl-CoA hydratase
MNVGHLPDWVGREQTAEDVAAARDAQRLAAVLGRSAPPREGEALPSCWHWTLFQPLQVNSELGPDGHPKVGEFLPPVPLPRRMFTGIEVEARQALLVGEKVRRRSVIEAIMPKQGNSGQMVFVTLRHTLASQSGGHIVEKHSFVYRDAERPNANKNNEKPVDQVDQRAFAWRRDMTADPVLLFRFAATTFNAHRIHYDRAYATEVEGYPERLVPGRLAALLLLEELWQRSPRPVTRFTFQARKPIWLGETLTLEGTAAGSERVDMRVATNALGSAMEARAEFGA